MDEDESHSTLDGPQFSDDVVFAVSVKNVRLLHKGLTQQYTRDPYRLKKVKNLKRRQRLRGREGYVTIDLLPFAEW